MKITTWLLAVACMAGMTGCAITDVRPVSPNAVRHARGFVIYDQIPVVIVNAPDDKGVQKIEMTTLPNMDQPRVVNSHAFFAKNNLNFTLQNGVLTSVNAQADTSTALVPVLNLLAATTGIPIAPQSKFVGGKSEPPKSAPAKQIIPPGMYKIRYNGYGVLCGLEPIHLFPMVDAKTLK